MFEFAKRHSNHENLLAQAKNTKFLYDFTFLHTENCLVAEHSVCLDMEICVRAKEVAKKTEAQCECIVELTMSGTLLESGMWWR